MKINILITLSLLFLSSLVIAQENPVMVISSKGKIVYFPPPPATPINLLPGMKIDAEGLVRLEEGTQIRLLNHGHTFHFKEKGDFDLGLLIAKKKNKTIGFATKFWGFINEGLINADSVKSLDEYHQEFMSSIGAVRGFATSNSAIQANYLTSENIGPSEATFRWSGTLPEDAVYQFSIYHTDTEQMVYHALCKKPFVQIDFKNIFFFPGSTYYWQVRVLSHKESEDSNIQPYLPEIKSEKVNFQFIENTKKIVSKKISRIEGYAEADEKTQQWMEAIILEQEHFYYDAFIIYENLYKKNPDDLLIKKLFSTFLIRQNLPDESQKILEGLNS